MRLLLALIACCVSAYGEIVLFGGGIVAQVADGGGVQTVLTLANLDPTSSDYTIEFFADAGTPLSLVTDSGTGSSFSGTLAPYATFTIQTSGVAATQVQGWANVVADGTVGGSAIFKLSTPPWTGSEATIPLDTWEFNHVVMIFDNSGTLSTGLAMVNADAVTSPFVLTIKDPTGNVILTDTIQIPPLGHHSLVLATAYPETVGKTGTVDVSSTAAFISVLGLRFGATAVSSMLPLISDDWVNAPPSVSAPRSLKGLSTPGTLPAMRR